MKKYQMVRNLQKVKTCSKYGVMVIKTEIMKSWTRKLLGFVIKVGTNIFLILICMIVVLISNKNRKTRSAIEVKGVYVFLMV